jgi:hypothetical protein
MRLEVIKESLKRALHRAPVVAIIRSTARVRDERAAQHVDERPVSREHYGRLTRNSSRTIREHEVKAE